MKHKRTGRGGRRCWRPAISKSRRTCGSSTAKSMLRSTRWVRSPTPTSRARMSFASTCVRSCIASWEWILPLYPTERAQRAYPAGGNRAGCVAFSQRHCFRVLVGTLSPDRKERRQDLVGQNPQDQKPAQPRPSHGGASFAPQPVVSGTLLSQDAKPAGSSQGDYRHRSQAGAHRVPSPADWRSLQRKYFCCGRATLPPSHGASPPPPSAPARIQLGPPSGLSAGFRVVH